jgi:hypothetical protein
VNTVAQAMDQGIGVRMEHAGAPKVTYEPTEPERAAEVEEGRGLPPDQREVHTGEKFLTRAEQTKTGEPQVIARSVDKVVSNIDRAVQWGKAAGETVPWETDANGALTAAGLNQLLADQRTYWDNQDRGFRGGGGKLVRPEGVNVSIPAEKGEGTQLGTEKEQWLNLLQGKDVGPPQTARTVKGQLPANIKAQEIRAAQGDVSERIAPGTNIPIYPEKATQGRGPVEVKETNPLRNRLRAAGMPVGDLHTVVERLNAADIVKAEPAPELQGKGGQTDIARAGYLPEKPVGETVKDVTDATPEQWQKFFGPQGSLTRSAYDLGLGLKDRADLDTLMAAQDAASKTAQATMAEVRGGNFDALDKASADATKAQFFREAIEAATDKGSAAGESGWRKSHPDAKPPFAGGGEPKAFLTPEAPPEKGSYESLLGDMQNAGLVRGMTQKFDYAQVMRQMDQGLTTEQFRNMPYTDQKVVYDIADYIEKNQRARGLASEFKEFSPRHQGVPATGVAPKEFTSLGKRAAGIYNDELSKELDTVPKSEWTSPETVAKVVENMPIERFQKAGGTDAVKRVLARLGTEDLDTIYSSIPASEWPIIQNAIRNWHQKNHPGDFVPFDKAMEQVQNRLAGRYGPEVAQKAMDRGNELAKKKGGFLSETALEPIRNGEKDGETFNADGSVFVPPTDAKLDVVPLTSINLPADQFTAAGVAKALEPFKETLKNENIKAGVFRLATPDAEGKQQYSVDINALVDQEHRDNSAAFAKANGQEGIYDLSAQESVATGGNGEAVLKSPAEVAKAAEALARGENPLTPGEADVKPLDDRWHVVWKPRAEGKTTLRQTVHAASAEEAQQKAGVPEGAHIVSTEPVYAPGMRRAGYLPAPADFKEPAPKKPTVDEKELHDGEVVGAAWVLPNGKWKSVESAYYHDDAATKMSQMTGLGESPTLEFQHQTGSLRVTNADSPRAVEEFGNSAMNVSFSRKPTSAQKNVILSSLDQVALEGEPYYSMFHADVHDLNGNVLASTSLPWPADRGKVARFLTDPFGEEFSKAPAVKVENYGGMDILEGTKQQLREAIFSRDFEESVRKAKPEYLTVIEVDSPANKERVAMKAFRRIGTYDSIVRQLRENGALDTLKPVEREEDFGGPTESDVRPTGEPRQWKVTWKPGETSKDTFSQTIEGATADEAVKKLVLKTGKLISVDEVKPGERGGYLPKKRAPKEEEPNPYEKYNVPASQKPKGDKPTGWVLPNGEYVPLDTDYHQTWLGENADQLNKQFGTSFSDTANIQDRQDAINKGFIRAREYNGNLTVEANQKFFKGKAKQAIETLLTDHAENLDRAQINLLNDDGQVVDQVAARLFDAEDPRGAAMDMLDRVKPEAQARKGGPSGIQIARSRGGYLPENIPPQGTPGFNDYAESLVAKAKSFPEVLAPELRRDKAGNVRAAWDGEPLFAAQEWDLFNTPLAKKSGSVDAFTTDLSKKMEEEYNSIKDRPELKGAEQWYELCRTKLREVLKTPEDIKLFGELLGATSPQQKVAPNFSDAVAAFNQIKSGAYDDMVAKYREGKAKFAAKDPEAMADFQKEASASAVKSGQLSDFLYWWADKHDLVPKKANGAKYGMNSRAVMKVLDGTWMESVEGPKTPSFTGNLIGLWFKGIVDKWAMRTMTRLSSEGQPWRIIHQAETGISNPEYFAGEKAFQEAADRIGIKPDALQAILWVNEQRLWEENGWARAGAQHGATYQGLLEHTTKTPEGKLEFTPPKPPKKVKSKVAKIVESQ